jgi:hypothetical protein
MFIAPDSPQRFGIPCVLPVNPGEARGADPAAALLRARHTSKADCAAVGELSANRREALNGKLGASRRSLKLLESGSETLRHNGSIPINSARRRRDGRIGGAALKRLMSERWRA